VSGPPSVVLLVGAAGTAPAGGLLRADLVGDWHCHPGGSTTVPSDQDVRSWQATREALGRLL